MNYRSNIDYLKKENSSTNKNSVSRITLSLRAGSKKCRKKGKSILLQASEQSFSINDTWMKIDEQLLKNDLALNSVSCSQTPIEWHNSDDENKDAKLTFKNAVFKTPSKKYQIKEIQSDSPIIARPSLANKLSSSSVSIGLIGQPTSSVIRNLNSQLIGDGSRTLESSRYDESIGIKPDISIPISPILGSKRKINSAKLLELIPSYSVHNEFLNRSSLQAVASVGDILEDLAATEKVHSINNATSNIQEWVLHSIHMNSSVAVNKDVFLGEVNDENDNKYSNYSYDENLRIENSLNKNADDFDVPKNILSAQPAVKSPLKESNCVNIDSYSVNNGYEIESYSFHVCTVPYGIRQHCPLSLLLIS